MYTSLVIGGTFDHLHDGHRQLISLAFSLSTHVTLGLTSPSMSSTKTYAFCIQSFEERKKQIQTYLELIGHSRDAKIIQIDDMYGTTLIDMNIQAIVVTQHSLEHAKQINALRKQHQLSELVIHISPFVLDQEGSTLSSTRIREGSVSESGFVYRSLLQKTLTISEHGKEIVRSPLGETFDSLPEDLNNERSPVFYIGDIVTERAISKKLSFSSAWIDAQSRRTPYQFFVPSLYILKKIELQNIPSTLTKDMCAYMHDHLLSHNEIIQIQGEEDLLVLPAVLYAPLQSLVIYGNPIQTGGVTLVRVTQERKEYIRNFLTDPTTIV